MVESIVLYIMLYLYYIYIVNVKIENYNLLPHTTVTLILLTHQTKLYSILNVYNSKYLFYLYYSILPTISIKTIKIQVNMQISHKFTLYYFLTLLLLL